MYINLQFVHYILLQAKSSTCPASNYKSLLTGWSVIPNPFEIWNWKSKILNWKFQIRNLKFEIWNGDHHRLHQESSFLTWPTQQTNIDFTKKTTLISLQISIDYTTNQQRLHHKSTSITPQMFCQPDHHPLYCEQLLWKETKFLCFGANLARCNINGRQ